MKPETDKLFVRHIDRAIYHRMRVAAAERRVPVGKLLNEAMAEWLAAREREREAPA